MARHHLLKLIQADTPGGTVVKISPAKAGDTRDASLISGSGRSHERGNGNPLQYFYLGNSMGRGV